MLAETCDDIRGGIHTIIIGTMRTSTLFVVIMVSEKFSSENSILDSRMSTGEASKWVTCPRYHWSNHPSSPEVNSNDWNDLFADVKSPTWRLPG